MIKSTVPPQKLFFIRNFHFRNIILLNSLNLAPDLYATFQNGLAYKYVPGCTLTYETVTNPEIYRLVATRMAKLHKTQQELAEKKPCIWDKLQKFFDLVPNKFTDEEKNARYALWCWMPRNLCYFIDFRYKGPTKQQIRTEIDRIRQHLSETSNPVVFCHNDLLLGNVIYTKEQNFVTFIDYEYAAFNYQAFDIANHFLEFAGLENVDYTKFPEEHLQNDWIRIYLKEFQNEFTETDVHRLFVNVNKFVLLSHLFWGLWALIQAEHSYINFDFLGQVFLVLF